MRMAGIVVNVLMLMSCILCIYFTAIGRIRPTKGELIRVNVLLLFWVVADLFRVLAT